MHGRLGRETARQELLRGFPGERQQARWRLHPDVVNRVVDRRFLGHAPMVDPLGRPSKGGYQTCSGVDKKTTGTRVGGGVRSRYPSHPRSSPTAFMRAAPCERAARLLHPGRSLLLFSKVWPGISPRAASYFSTSAQRRAGSKFQEPLATQRILGGGGAACLPEVVVEVLLADVQAHGRPESDRFAETRGHNAAPLKGQQGSIQRKA